MLYSINWPNFFVWLPLLLEILGNMCIAIAFNKAVKISTKICLRPERAPLKTHTFLFWHNILNQLCCVTALKTHTFLFWHKILSQLCCVTASVVVSKLTCGKLIGAQWWFTPLDCTNHFYDLNHKSKKVQVIKLNFIYLVSYRKQWLVEKLLKQMNFLTNFEGKGPWLIKIRYYLFILQILEKCVAPSWNLNKNFLTNII